MLLFDAGLHDVDGQPRGPGEGGGRLPVRPVHAGQCQPPKNKQQAKTTATISHTTAERP